MFQHFVVLKGGEERAESKLIFLKIRFWKSHFSDFSWPGAECSAVTEKVKVQNDRQEGQDP